MVRGSVMTGSGPAARPARATQPHKRYMNGHMMSPLASGPELFTTIPGQNQHPFMRRPRPRTGMTFGVGRSPAICSEAFFVLEGTVAFVLDGQESAGGAGDFLLVPRGAAHTFGNGGADTARLLVLHAPAMDAYFEELHRLWSGAQPPEREQERASDDALRHGARVTA